MLHNLLLNSTFHEFLKTIDDELADKVQKAGCQHCKGHLHQSNYPRHPLGLSKAHRIHYQWRRSFCCSRCRKRTTSPSVRFFGRRWFPSPFLILISALMKGPNQRRCTAIKKHFGIVVNKRTWQRWRLWWQEYFQTTSFWQQVKGFFPLHALRGPFPRSLLDSYAGSLKQKILHLLRFLTPLSIPIFHAI
jgi:hypothetical protein